MQIILYGKASNTKRIFKIDDDYDSNLMTWLRDRNVLIASSCSGQGICKKCVIQNDWLSCKLTIKEFLDREPQGIIEVSYL